MTSAHGAAALRGRWLSRLSTLMKPLRLPLSLLAGLVVLLGGFGRIAAQPAAAAVTVTVQADRPGARIAPTMFGLFFEDINFAADGGLDPERVKNRSFEFPDPLIGWRPVTRDSGRGSLQVFDRGNGGANAHYLRLTAATASGYGVANEGFRGVGVEQGAGYRFSARVRRAGGDAAALRVLVEDAGGKSAAEARLTDLGTTWREVSATVRPSATVPKGRLVLMVEGSGALDLDLVSLRPVSSGPDRGHGLRPDLAQLLRELKPGFLRFPGGCIIEGRTLETRYQWKVTIGPPEERRLIVNRWNSEFRHRPTPDYYQSFGLGFFEYFELCEAIGAEPLPVLNCGMACQFNSGELAPLDALEPYVQDALDLIEFANGSPTSRWGRKRADMGHPAPFRMKLIGVGNEQWGPQYVERYRAFAAAIERRHPEIAIVGSVGPGPGGEQFEYLWRAMRALKADVVDEHYYMAPRWFRENAGRYDGYPRTGPKVFAGEYAAQSVRIGSPENRNDWECALSEAAFITGLERNADVVTMSSYAPLFAHVEGWQWTPNLIWFDNLRSYGTPNYYVQQLFGTNRGSVVLPVLQDGSPKNGQGELFTSAARHDRTGEVVLKLVNTAPAPRAVRVNLSGASPRAATGTAITLAHADLKAENSLDEPKKVAPVTRPFPVPGAEFPYTLPAQSFTVLRVAAR